jgi:hypothetical protein
MDERRRGKRDEAEAGRERLARRAEECGNITLSGGTSIPWPPYNLNVIFLSGR